MTLNIARIGMLLSWSPIESYLIFVTSITYILVEKKLVMWRNFRFQYMTHVEKSKISPHVEEFQIFHTTDVEKSDILPNLDAFKNSTHDRCEEI